MGKSRLSLGSTAFKRQMEFYTEDQPRLEKNKLVVWDPFNDEDDVSLFDSVDRQDDDNTQHDESTSLLRQLGLLGARVKGNDNRKDMIRRLKGAQRGTYFPKKGGASSASNYITSVRVLKMERKLTYLEKKENTSSACKDNTRIQEAQKYTQNMPLELFTWLVDDLENKRASIREKTLLELVDMFERSVLQEHLETYCITICHGCLNSFVVGSAYESYLASRVIGLLAITVGTGSNSHELMQNSISKFSLAWKAECEFLKLSFLDCLAITTFFGANEEDEVEKSMRVMWEIFRPTLFSESGSVNKPTAAVLAKAISAWSFLLTTIDIWRISQQMWKESVSFFLTLLENDDCWVSIAAAEAIAVIFETGRLDKFTSKGDVDSTEIISKIKKLVNQAKETPRKDLKNMRQILQAILEFLETGKYHEESIKIPNKREPLEVSAVTQSIQLKFFKRFLGWSGLLKHMQDNKVLYDVLDYGSEKRETTRENSFIKEKVKRTLPTLKAHKERLQLRTQHRMGVEEMHYGYGHLDITCHE